MTDKIGLPQPYFPPGYGGHLPRWEHKYGLGFSPLSHKVLMNPESNLANYYVLSKTRPAYTVKTTNFTRGVTHDKYQPGIRSGYTGYFPRKGFVIGLVAEEERQKGLEEFDQRQELMEMNRREVEKIIQLQSDSSISYASCLQNRQMKGTQTNTPLKPVQTVLGVPSKNEDNLEGHFHYLPYFLPCCHKQKYIKSGATVHVPRGQFKFGMVYECATRQALCEFTNTYNKSKESMWKKVTLPL